MSETLILVLLAASLAVSAGTVSVLRMPSRRLGLIDHPGGRKRHGRPIPLCGGLAIYISFVLGLALSGLLFSREGAALAAGGAILLGVGLVDDLRSTSASLRMLVQVAVVLVFMVWLGDARLWSLGDLFGQGGIALEYLAIPATVFGVIGVINAFNMIDGLDGLAGGIAAIALAGMTSFALAGGDMPGAIASALLLAAVSGFLVFNFPRRHSLPGKVFMGNSGSLFLGFALGWLAVDLTQGDNAAMRPMTAVWLLGLPIGDTLRVMLRRMLRGQGPFTPGRDHLHHVLQALGLGKRATLSVMLTFTALLAGFGTLGEVMGISEGTMLAVAVIVFLGICGFAELARPIRLRLLRSRRMMDRLMQPEASQSRGA